MNASSPVCHEFDLALHALADGELDAANALEVETHIRNCVACAKAYDEILRHKALMKAEGVYMQAPEDFRERLLSSFATETPSANPESGARIIPLLSRHWTLAVGSALALAASLIVVVNIWLAPRQSLDDELVAGHVRSLLAAHLTDVASSDQHTVEPWFSGKLGFTPPVQDLSQQGFQLVGGRLDYASGHVVPALIYKRGEHVLNLFIWPDATAPAAKTSAHEGYQLLAWSGHGFHCALVSDLYPDEMKEFHQAWQAGL